MALAGCIDLTGLNFGEGCCGMSGGGGYSFPLTLTQADNMLRGDSARIRAWGSQGDPASTWELTGPAVFVLSRDSVATRVTTPVDAVTIRTTGTGEVRVKALRAGTIDSTTTSFFVADSADVTLSMPGPKDRTVRLAAETWISAQLLDRTGRWYRAALIWSSSDTGAVTLADGVNPTPLGKMAHGRVQGAASVVVAFGVRHDTVRVQVVP